jgi:hypothetical protein
MSDGSDSSWIERHGRQLNALCNVGVLLLSLLALGTAASRWMDRPQTTATPRLGVAAGQSAGGYFHPNDKTVLAAISTQCALCAQEVSVYRELETRFAHRPGIGFVYLMPDAVDVGRRFIEETGLAGAAHFSQDLGKWGVRDIPLLVVLDRRGVVRFSVSGALSPAQKKELESVLAR